MTKLEELIENNAIECSYSIDDLSENVKNSTRCIIITDTLEAVSEDMFLDDFDAYGYDIAVICGEKNKINIDGIDKLQGVVTVDIYGYEGDIDFALFGSMPKLKDMCIADCDNIYNLDGIGNSTSIERLLIFCCMSLDNIDDIKNLSELHSLGIYKCNSVRSIRELSSCAKLHVLCITECKYIYDFESINEFKKLKDIELCNCDINSLDMFSNLHNLVTINVSKNAKLVNIEGINI